MSARLPIQTSIRPADDLDVRDPGNVWKVSFTKTYDGTSSTSNVEFLTQGELITLWQQIGALFDLAGMRAGLSDEDLKRIGVHRRK